MREAFIGTADSMMLFFRACQLFKISDTDLAAKKALLRRLVARKTLKYRRDGEQLLKGKRVVRIVKERPSEIEGRKGI